MEAKTPHVPFPLRKLCDFVHADKWLHIYFRWPLWEDAAGPVDVTFKRTRLRRMLMENPAFIHMFNCGACRPEQHVIPLVNKCVQHIRFVPFIDDDIGTCQLCCDNDNDNDNDRTNC